MNDILIISLVIWILILFFIIYGQQAKIKELEKIMKQMATYEEGIRLKINKMYDLAMETSGKES